AIAPGQIKKAKPQLLERLRNRESTGEQFVGREGLVRGFFRLVYLRLLVHRLLRLRIITSIYDGSVGRCLVDARNRARELLAEPAPGKLYDLFQSTVRGKLQYLIAANGQLRIVLESFVRTTLLVYVLPRGA